MAASRARLVLAGAVLAVLLYAGASRVGPVPALGGFLDPAGGAWALARVADLPRRSAARIPGLGAPVEVRYDDRGVPHIFAASEEDAWRAEGYVVARDRLFQLELQTRAAAGTLAELLGPNPRIVAADRTARRRGLGRAADRIFAGLDSTALIARAVRAYAQGVNAWIAGMSRGELPLEYRLLGARPAVWEPRHSLYLFHQMALTLAWDDPTLLRLRVRGLVGAAATEALFPLNSPIQEPIQPNGEAAPRYDFVRPLPPPGVPDTAAELVADARERAGLGLGLSQRRPGDGDAIGSNNWTVGPGRTAAGRALLAGDPHLELTLPSIWYEIHLHVAGGPDVAGVTLVGSPGVIIGFNRNVAWSFTNTGADVRDLYVETVDDSLRPARYRLDGEWRPVERRVEVVRGRHGAVLATDTVYFTHRGPMLREGGRWLSTRWTPFEASRPGEEFLRLDRAATVAEWLDGWKGYVAAAQNGVAADRAGTIAVRSTGKYPVRPGDGRGDELREGSTRAADWTGYLPLELYPFSLNPPQGFLASANQQPVDPRMNPRYFGSNWYSPWRALRINQLLRADSAVTPDAMRRYQTDPGSARADAFVPLFLGSAAALDAGGRSDDTLRRAAKLLAEWDRRYSRDNRRAMLFETAMGQLTRLVWDELVPPAARGDTAAEPVEVPAEAVLLELASDSTSAWWDDRRTPLVERRDAILGAALRRGLLLALRDLGPPDGDGWLWSRAHHANIYHLLRIPALSALDLPVQGGPSTLSPSPGRGNFGPSWRMVVELGPRVRAWATYPGGQSGNPASPRYRDRLETWLAGDLDTVLFPATPAELPAARTRSVLSLTGRR
ncbi:MAG TPA: penicillin acylase family protein [Gemmatimonadales bacterium]|jgi:penicillin amidase|nr:penicillin acylase family protein [Gemmatimonadales bacterium]